VHLEFRDWFVTMIRQIILLNVYHFQKSINNFIIKINLKRRKQSSWSRRLLIAQASLIFAYTEGCLNSCGSIDLQTWTCSLKPLFISYLFKFGNILPRLTALSDAELLWLIHLPNEFNERRASFTRELSTTKKIIALRPLMKWVPELTNQLNAGRSQFTRSLML